MRIARAIGQSPAILIAGGLLWLGLTGYLLSRDPWLGFMVGIAPAVLFVLLRSAGARLVAVVIGGMVVLGSSSDLNSAKVVYAATLVVCAVISASQLAADPPAVALQFRPLVWWGLAVIAVLILGFFSPQNDPMTFARQSIFYLLAILGPIVGVDAGRRLPPHTAYAIVGLVGVIAAIGFAADWLDRRQVTSLGTGRFVLSSLLLPALAFALALVLVFHSKRLSSRLLWLTVVLVIPVAMLVTGTRTNLIVLLAIPLVLGRIRNFRVPPIRMSILVLLAGSVGVALFLLVASVVISDPAFIPSRIRAVLTIIAGDAEADASFAGRSEQFQIASALVAESPWLGHGLGAYFGFTLDTFLLTVVRIGWVGTAALIGFVVATCRAVWLTRREFGPSPGITAWWVLIAAATANIAFGTPFEDRGFGFAIMLGTMVVASDAAAAFRQTTLFSSIDLGTVAGSADNPPT